MFGLASRTWQTSPSQCWDDPSVHARVGASTRCCTLASGNKPANAAIGQAPGGRALLPVTWPLSGVTWGRRISTVSAEAPRSGTEPCVGSSLVLYGSAASE